MYTHLQCTGTPQQPHYGSHSVSPHYRVIQQHNTLALDVFSQSSKLLADAKLTQPGARLNEGTTDVTILTEHFNIGQVELRIKVQYIQYNTLKQNSTSQKLQSAEVTSQGQELQVKV